MWILKLFLVLGILGLIALAVWLIVNYILNLRRMGFRIEQERSRLQRAPGMTTELLNKTLADMAATGGRLPLARISLCFLGALALLTINSSMVDIPGTGFGTLNRNFGGGSMKASQILATQDENGPQAKLISPGLNFIPPFMYTVDSDLEPKVIGEGKIGIVTTQDGIDMPDGMTYAPAWENAEPFLDAQLFLDSDKGYKGQQVTVLLPGAYKFHPSLYKVDEADLKDVPVGHVSVVRANYGEEPNRKEVKILDMVEKEISLNKEELAAAVKEATQEEHKRQLAMGVPEDRISIKVEDLKVKRTKVILEEQTKTILDPLVDKGHKGVWRQPLTPGKYAMHPRAHQFVDIQTMKVKLAYNPDEKTGKGEGEGHENTQIIVRSKDGFEFPIDIRLIYHIEEQDAPWVVATVGDDELVEDKVVTPAVRSVMRILVGRSGALDFVADIEIKQKESKHLIAAKCAVYGVTVDEVLIGRVGDEATLGSLMKTQRDREIAAQQQITFGVQQQAAERQKSLNKAQQEAEEEKKLAQAAYAVTIAEQRKQETIKNAEAQAEQKKIAADAEATRLLKIKTAEAEGYRLKVAALGAPAVATLESLQLISDGKINITPNVMVTGGSAGGTMDALMGTILGQAAGALQK